MYKDKQRQWGTVISPQSSSSGSPDSRRGDDSRSESAAKVLARDEAGERRWRVYIIGGFILSKLFSASLSLDESLLL